MTCVEPSNVFERMNPLVKIGAVLSVGLSTLVFPSSWLGLGIVALLFVGAGVARMFGSFAKAMFGFGIPLTVMLLFIQGCYSPRNRTSIADLGFAKVGIEGVLYAVKIVVTLLVFLGSFTIMNRTTYPGRLVAALNATGLSPKVGYLVLASLNVVPQMQRRMAVIQEAQNARGLGTSGGLISRIKASIPLLGPVVMSSLTDAQERGMTLETRGFGIKGVKRTSYLEVPFTRGDALALTALVAFFLIVLVLSVLIRMHVIGGV